MSDQGATPGPAPKSSAGKGMKIALALSLAVNLAVLGMVTGAALKFHRDGPPRPEVRDLSFGPFTEALTRDQRRALLGTLRQAGLEPGRVRDEMRADLLAVLYSLRARPFDPIAFQTALERQNRRLSERTASGRQGLVDIVAAMSDEERQAFAAGLERKLSEGRMHD